MKKTYVKPEVLFESFASSTNIAGNCQEIIKNHDEGTCAYIVTAGPGKEWHIFTGEIPNVCTTNEGLQDGTVDGIYNGYCYDVPSGAIPLFNS